MSARVYALFGNFCYVGGFCNLGDPMLPNLWGASRDVVGTGGPPPPPPVEVTKTLGVFSPQKGSFYT